MKRKGKKNIINVLESVSLFRSFGFRVRAMNTYQFRISSEESKRFYDWYHTTGSLVVNYNGYNSRAGTFLNAEELAEYIQKNH